MSNKKTIRQLMRERCRQIPLEQRKIAAKKAAELFVQSDLFKNNQQIACYLSNDYEIETIPMINALWRAQKKCYLPLIHPEKPGLLLFQLFTAQDPLSMNRFHIAEPVFNPARQILPEHLDLVLMPVDAFDKKGHRIGKGGGYYDRTFSFKKPNQKPILCGVAYAIQEIAKIENNTWDVIMDAILTEIFTDTTT